MPGHYKGWPGYFKKVKTNYMLTVTKMVEQEVQIKPPCWFFEKVSGRHYFINERGDLVSVGDGIVVLYTIEDSGNKSEVARILKSAHGCTEMEFKEALDKQLYNIQETVTA